VFRRLALVALAGCVGVACHTPPPRFAEGPLASPLARWIPADAVMVIARGGSGASAIDRLARELQVPVPSKFAPYGGLWILLDEDAQTTARCAPGATPAEPDGTVSRSGGALLVESGDTVTVYEDGIACTVASAVASRRARHAVRLAGLADDERLVADAKARAAIDALPPDVADVIAWGAGDVIGGGISDELSSALGTLGNVAVGMSFHEDGSALHVYVRPERGLEGFESKVVKVGLYAQPPVPPPLPPLPVPPRDENTDVPESADYRAAVQRLTQLLFAAAEAATEITTREDNATAAWIAAWGNAILMPSGDGILLTWSPTISSRHDADRARDAARAGIDELRARHERLVADAEAMLPELVKIRARDVAAHDRARR
jgi:hypothetical protein